MFSFFKKNKERDGDSPALASSGSSTSSTSLNTTEMFTKTVSVVLSALDAKGAYTKGRSGRITYYAVKVAEQIGLSEEEVAKIEMASMLHDLGMNDVPDEILYKEGKLTQDEYDLIKQHVLLGIKPLINIDVLKPIIPIIMHHHEHWDGSGYPDNMKGERIPIGSRIILLVDAYDAMVSDRAYRGAKTHEEAVAEIKKCAGKQFDPNLTNVFDNICYDPLMGIETLEPDEYVLE